MFLSLLNNGVPIIVHKIKKRSYEVEKLGGRLNLTFSFCQVCSVVFFLIPAERLNTRIIITEKYLLFIKNSGKECFSI